MSVFEERPYQSQAIAASIVEFDKGVNRQLWVMATGTGKTVCYSKAYEAFKSRLPGQMIVYAHTEELVEQNRKKLQEMNPDVKVGKEMAGDYADPQSDIISASVATLGRAGSKRPERFNWSNIDKVIVDEAHHSTGDAYSRALGFSVHTPNKLLLGVTATSQRPDGKALSDIYEKVSYVYGLRQAIKDGYLVDIRGYRVNTRVKLDDVASHGGDFAQTELALAVNTPQRNEQVVAAWEGLDCTSRQTLVFCVNIQHSKDMAQAFKDAGYAAEAIWGDDPDRAAKIQAHRDGTIRVLCNCSVLTEGYDDPPISCIIIARPTQSGILFSQMVGRGTRLFLGKTSLIVIDVVDATMRHSLMTLPTLMGLSNVLDLNGKSLLTSVEEIEAAQIDYPSCDFTTLKSIDDLQTVIKSVDMFEVRFPAEVEKNSDLTWFRAIDGGYKILIPKGGPEKAGWLRIYENQLGRWDIVGQIKEVDLAATRTTMEEAFKASDEQIRKRIGNVTLQYILREATWHNKPVTKGQRAMITRLFPHKIFPFEQMTSGMASKVISERLAKKA